MRIYQEKKEYTTNKKINEKNILTKILKKKIYQDNCIYPDLVFIKVPLFIEWWSSG